jgi:ubiquinone/menaquinone biosynthesis C-methylase UbiE
MEMSPQSIARWAMSKKFDPRKKDILLTAEREAQMHPHALLISLGVKSGDVVADVGCGPGFFAIPAAEIVGPDGRVYAADVQSDMIAAMMMRVFETGLRNIEILKASETDVSLPAAGIDLILLAFMLHELSQRSGYLFRLRRALRPGGRLAILEWQADPASDAPPTENPITIDELLDDARAAGFGLVERRELLPEHHLLIFTAR